MLRSEKKSRSPGLASLRRGGAGTGATALKTSRLWLRDKDEKTAGDCGPHAVLMAVQLMLARYPSIFDAEYAPSTVAEVRAIAAAMVLNGACELDVLPSGSGRPEVGSLFTRHAREFGSRPGEGPEERRARLAHLLRRDESDSGGGGGVVWFTHELVAHAYNHIMSSSFVRNRNSPATALMKEFMEECPIGGLLL